MKTILHTLTVLLITVVLGVASYYIIQSLPQASFTGGRGGERPAFANAQTEGIQQQSFRGEREGNFEGARSFGLAGGLLGIAQNLVLFAIGTVLIVMLGKLLSKRRPVPQT